MYSTFDEQEHSRFRVVGPASQCRLAAQTSDDTEKIEENVEPIAKDAETDEDPFCCDSMGLYHPRRTAHDTTFRNFVDGVGSVTGLVFQVKKQVDNGPMISEKYFTLRNGASTEVKGSFNQKVHAYKNYKCTKCNRFFGVDLYKESNAVGSNYHHMRVNAYGRRNHAIERAVFV